MATKPPAGVEPRSLMMVNPGDVLAGKYRVEYVLGIGGMGIVVAATHTELLERRAIKLMRPEGADSADSVERFLREARAAARLRSEHIAKVHDVGRLESGAPFMVMEYLEGTDLNMLLKARRTLPPEEAVLYVLQACEALAEAHASGIVHRDLKPANLFLTQGTDGSPHIKVLDFGISKATVPDSEASLRITRSDALLGSPLFMSPEQMRSPRDADPRSDIWSVGAILYKLVTGRSPFMAESILALFLLVMERSPQTPSALNAAIPVGLDEVILRCLEKDPAKRYASVADLSEALLPFAPAGSEPLVKRISRVLVSSGPLSGDPSRRSRDGISARSMSSALPLGRMASAPLLISSNGALAVTMPSPRCVDPGAPTLDAAQEPRDVNAELDLSVATLQDESPETSLSSWGHTRGELGPAAKKRRHVKVPLAIASAVLAASLGAAILALWSGPSAGEGSPATVVASLPSAAAAFATISGLVEASNTGWLSGTEPAPPISSQTVATLSTVMPNAIAVVPAVSTTMPAALPGSGSATASGPRTSSTKSPTPGSASPRSTAAPAKKPDLRSRSTF